MESRSQALLEAWPARSRPGTDREFISRPRSSGRANRQNRKHSTSSPRSGGHSCPGPQLQSPQLQRRTVLRQLPAIYGERRGKVRTLRHFLLSVRCERHATGGQGNRLVSGLGAQAAGMKRIPDPLLHSVSRRSRSPAPVGENIALAAEVRKHN